MNYLIDLTSLSYHLSGIERFAICMTEEMLKKDSTNSYILLFRDNIHESFRKYIDGNRIKAKVIHGNNKLLFFQIIIPFYLYKIKADAYIFFAFPAPILFFNKNIYNTIHDMGRWDFPGKGKIALFYYRTTESSAIKKSKHIFTVSEFSKNRIADIMNIPATKISVTYNGISKTLIDSKQSLKEVNKKYNLPNKYIMFLSTLQPRKNLNLLIDAFSDVKDLVDFDLVLIGRKVQKIEELIIQKGVVDRVVVTGFVEDLDVAAIYKNALCFIFPTLYEGFGIPPVEALSMGCPVISSDSSCMKEILRNQATYFENNNKEELAKLLVKLNENVNKMPRKLDEFQIENFSYAKSAQTVLDILNEQ